MKRRREEEGLDDEENKCPIVFELTRYLTKPNMNVYTMVATDTHVFANDLNSGMVAIPLDNFKQGQHTSMVTSIVTSGAVYHLALSKSRNEIFASVSCGKIQVFSSIPPFPRLRSWKCQNARGEDFNGLGNLAFDEGEDELLIAGRVYKRFPAEMLLVYSADGQLKRELNVEKWEMSEISSWQSLFLIDGNIWIPPIPIDGGYVIMDKFSGHQLNRIHGDGLPFFPRAFAQLGELIIFSSIDNNRLSVAHTRTGKHITTIAFDEKASWSGLQLATTTHKQLLVNTKDGVEIFSIRHVLAIALLCGMHPRCGRNSVLCKIAKTCPLFDRQVLRLPLRLAGVLFHLKSKKAS